MPIIGITITKETAFRDSVQQFTNMYFYNNGVGTVPGQAEAEALIDELVVSEKKWHTSVCEFVYARCWHQTLLQITTEMIFQKALSGLGGGGSQSVNMDKERAYLFRWRAGNDSRGQPVYLRKWYHTAGGFGTALSAPASGYLANTTGFSASERTAMANLVQEVANLGGSPGPWDLCAKSGRGITGSVFPESHRYLEHHQMGDNWRGA
jgi:hypothetical protein